MVKVPGKVSSRLLTQKLTEAMEKTYSVDDDGSIITRADRLSELLWWYALGDGKDLKPAPWALQLVMEKIEGKTPTAINEEQSGRLKASDKLEETLVKRINAMKEEIVSEFVCDETNSTPDEGEENLDLPDNETGSSENDIRESGLETESDSDDKDR